MEKTGMIKEAFTEGFVAGLKTAGLKDKEEQSRWAAEVLARG